MVNTYRILSLMNEVVKTGVKCSAHSTCGHTSFSKVKSHNCEYAFEMSCSNIRYGPGVTGELGMDVVNFNAKKALLLTDKNVSKLASFKVGLDSLSKHGVIFDLYDEVNIEPTDVSMMHAVNFARKQSEPYDMFIAIGGGSVMDTCKVVNLLHCHREAELLDYVPLPIGKGKLSEGPLKPMIAVPTTSGTGSETTGVAVFDLLSMEAKVGINQRLIKPNLALVDPDHTGTLPRDVSCFSGFDVFCHALESYISLPYNQRSPRPTNPKERPTYQGSNPISDVWSTEGLRIIEKYFRRSVNDSSDTEARNQMHLAGTLAGMGFGNAGVHLCHGMSYPISGLARMSYSNNNDYKPVNDKHKPLIPHGLSVVITAPAVFKYTSEVFVDRHLNAARILDPKNSVFNMKQTDGGEILSDVIRQYMRDLSIPDGLRELGYSTADIPKLVEGTLPQQRVTKLSPRSFEEEDLHSLFEKSMKVF